MAIVRQRIIDWLGNVLSDTSPTPAETQVIDDLASCQWMEVARTVMVSYVVAAIQRSEIVFRTNGERSYDRDAWLWNVSPNPNQSRAEFMSVLLTRLLRDHGDALVVPVKKRGKTSIYIADNFTPEPHPGGNDVFANISIERSSEVVRRSLPADSVYYFRIDADSSWMRLLKSMDALYDQLGTSVAQALIETNSRKYVLGLDQDINGTEKQRSAIEKYITGNLKSFVRSSNAILPLYKGMTLDRLSAGPTGTISSVNAATSQTTAIRKDMFATAAACCRIPVSFLEGNTNNFDQLLESFLTFAVDPIAKGVIAEEITRKTYTQEQWSASRGQTCVTFDTTRVRHVDLFGVADNVAKLIASSVESPNEIRTLTGQERIDQPWADEYQRTKNNEAAGGGDNNANQTSANAAPSL